MENPTWRIRMNAAAIDQVTAAINHIGEPKMSAATIQCSTASNETTGDTVAVRNNISAGLLGIGVTSNLTAQAVAFQL